MAPGVPPAPATASDTARPRGLHALSRHAARPVARWTLLALLLAAGPARGVQIDWVTIGDPGNPPDPLVMNCCEEAIGLSNFGSVDYVYRIARTEVTVAQWVEFLNAVAASDPNGLYNDGNNDRFMSKWVTRSGSPGSYSYVAVPGTEDLPIGFIDFFDALRFANWLDNGQPTGAQDATTTEDGAYTLLGSNPVNVTRNPGATVFLTSEDEWYKAAFYDPFTQDYVLYPTQSDVPTDGAFPPGGPNTANIKDTPTPPDPCDPLTSPCDQTPVGSYPQAASFFGTFDQCGNHLEWNESLYGGLDRGFRGGWYNRGPGDCIARNADSVDPTLQNLGGMGFRVATLAPDPLPECADGLDNDGDGAVDATEDIGCRDYDGIRENPHCQDGVNNDPGMDSFIDFDGGASAGLPPAQQTSPDPECQGEPWRSEVTPRCGLGAETLLLLAPAWLLRRRSARRTRGDQTNT